MKHHNFSAWVQIERRSLSLSVGELASLVGVKYQKLACLVRGAQPEEDLFYALVRTFASMHAKNLRLSKSEEEIFFRNLRFDAIQKIMVDYVSLVAI